VSAALRLERVALHFGGVLAVNDVSLEISTGEFVGLIGPNGAGKTTLVRIVAGMLRPDRGRVFLGEDDVTNLPTQKRVRLGLALTHQIVRPFREMTALDNVVLAAGYRSTSSPFQALSNVGRRVETERAVHVLARVGLAGAERKLAGALPLGQLKRLEVARALALDPKIILLDEPLAGLNHAEASKQIDAILEVHASGVTIALVEHNLEEVLRVCRRLVVLNNGAIIADGPPSGVMADPAVREAYVGAGTDHHAAH
jgi:branched-chain amino acid transport system ATP-binding protein